MSLNLSSTSAKEAGPQKRLDKTGNIVYTNTMNNKSGTPEKQKRQSQQLVNHDPGLWKLVKIAALMAEKTMTEYVEDVLRKHMAKDQQPEKKGKL